MRAPQGDFLAGVIENKKLEVKRLQEIGMTMLGMLADAAPKPRDFLASLRGRKSVPIIAEIKKSAPSWGPCRKEVNVKSFARMYEASGAAAISVLTDSMFFRGSIDDLTAVRCEVIIPVLRKDFIISVEQLYDARAAHADAVLLILAMLDDHELRKLYDVCIGFGMTPLLEIHDESEVKRALQLDPKLIGINNRNLKSLEVDLGVSERLRRLIPSDVTVVAESGVSTEEDITRLLNAGIDGFLIGTSLMKSSNPGQTLYSFVNMRRA